MEKNLNNQYLYMTNRMKVSMLLFKIKKTQKYSGDK